MKPSNLLEKEMPQDLASVRQSALSSLATIGLTVRNASLADVNAIDALFDKRYPPEIAREISPYESMRVIHYGRVFILENEKKDIVACQYSVPYHTDIKIAYAMRLIVSADYEGKKIADNLYRLLTVAAVDDGNDVQDSLVSVGNNAIHNMILNNMGACYTGIVEENLTGVHHHLVSRLNLKGGNLFRRVTSMSLNAYLDNASERDFEVIECDDICGIAALFKKQNHNAVALIRPEWRKGIAKPSFLFTQK